MEVKAYFKNIENIIINELKFARKSIKIAVAWFTNDKFKSTLEKKVNEGISVEILLNDDDINHLGDKSIDFSKFTKDGGKLALCKGNNSIMHEKFCIIDDKVLIEGTFNWTYYAENRNDEHIVVFKDFPKLLQQFIERYENLKKKYAVSTSENLQSHSEILAKLESIDKQGKSKDYIDEFSKFWEMHVSSKYMFDQEEFDIQQIFIEFEEEYQNILAEREEQKQREELQKYTDSFRKKFLYDVPEITNLTLLYTNVLHTIQEKLNDKSISDKLKGISASEVCVNSSVCKEKNVWDYLKGVGVPFVVDKEYWYDSIFNPNPEKYCKYSDCIGYSDRMEDINIRMHTRNLKAIEDVFNLRLIVTDDLQQPESFDFARERSLYIQMMKDGYSTEQIKKHVYQVEYGKGDQKNSLSDVLYTMSMEQLEDLMLAVRGFKAHSFNILDKIMESRLSMPDIYKHLDKDLPKTLKGYRWWQHFKERLWMKLPINIFSENTCYYRVQWFFLQSIIKPKQNQKQKPTLIEALEDLCGIDLSCFEGENTISTVGDNYWIPKEIVTKLPLGKPGLEKFYYKTSKDILLKKEIGYYYEIFNRIKKELHNTDSSS